ncbi:MAG: pectate lyase, partial [Armatimonadota bacterium]
NTPSPSEGRGQREPCDRGGRGRVLAATALLVFVLSTLVIAAPSAATAQTGTVPWSQGLRQAPAWYGTPEAVRIADNLLLYQNDNGGWEKNIDMAKVLPEKDRAALIAAKKNGETGIDNGATFTQLTYLARVYDATKAERFRAPFLKGIDFLLAAQYENGGWPQFFPLRKGYYTHITFNDNAMVGTMTLLRDIARKEAPYTFVDEARRAKAEKAVQKGTECILKCQITVAGKPTAWCAQHDERTFAPAPARAYELISLSGSESVGITRFLMGVDNPSPSVVRSVQGAAAWFETAKLNGIRVEEQPDSKAPKGRNRVVVKDPAAPPLWARFYEIGTNLPMFCDRDGVVKRSLAEIGYERRNGYAWLGEWPRNLLEKEYPSWQKKRLKSAATR